LRKFNDAYAQLGSLRQHLKNRASNETSACATQKQAIVNVHGIVVPNLRQIKSMPIEFGDWALGQRRKELRGRH
jgi:hypothetical protein